jgi:TonB family protein
MHTSKWLSSALLTVALSVPVNAQTGPSDARILDSTFRAPDMPHNDSMERYAVVEFSVSPEGHLIDGRIIQSSGDAAYDEQAVQRLASSLKARPEISADGAVLASGTIRLAYGNKRKRKPSGAFPPPAKPRLSESEFLAAEGARILRMKCKDFLWEYDLMKALRARVGEEQMPRIAMAVYLAARKLPTSQINDVFAAGKKGLPKSAEACREKPDAMFINDVLTPTLDDLMK